jgi:hypothetical protein
MEDKKQNDENVKRDPSFAAATHDTDIAPPKAPGKAEHKSESTGRRSDESWKEKKKTDGQ